MELLSRNTHSGEQREFASLVGFSEEEGTLFEPKHQLSSFGLLAATESNRVCAGLAPPVGDDDIVVSLTS